MTDQELVNALRRNMVETGSLICLGCGYEHNCSICGCAIMRTAADRLDHLLAEREKLAVITQQNEPLTMDELRGMGGQPVWVKSGGRVFACIVQKQRTLNNNVFAHGFHDYDGIRLVHDVTFTFMASDVECYRRPPEKGE